LELKRLILIIIFITACSSSEKKQKDVIPEQIPTSINSFFDSKPSVMKIDSTLFSSIEKWSQIVSFSEKFSDLINKEINHNLKIKSLTVDIKKINKDNMPIEFKTSPIIGRLRVLKTFMQKIDSYILDQENLEEYKSDIVNLLESYNALIYQINLRAKENLEN
tara:strand:- start:623 stop:1111 length:489 start_codon:yes stop_codon:yes gene_type:complete